MNSGTNPPASFSFGGGTGTPASSAQTTGGFPFGSGGGFNFGSKPNFSFGTPTASTTASVLSTAATNPTFGTAGNFGALKSTTTTTGSQFGMPNTTLSTQCVFGTAASGTFGGVQATTQNMAGISGQSTTQPTGLFSGLSSGTPATTQGLFTASASATFSTPQKTGSAGLFSGVAAPVGGGQSSATFSTPPKTGSAGLFSGVAAPVGGGQSIFQQKSAPNTGGTTTLFSGATTSVANPSFNFGSSASSTATAAPSFASTSTTLGSQPGMMFGAPGTGATKGFSFSAVSLASTTNGAQATNTTFAGFAVPKPGTGPTLGGTTSAPAQNAGTGFKLGGVSTATATPSTAGAVGTTFSGIAATKPSTGFNLGGTSVSATTTQAGGAGFKLGGGTTQATTPQTTGAGFKVGGSTNTAQPGLTGAASTTPVASFGTTTASTSSQPMQKLALGQSTTGFNFAGQLSGQAKTPATTTPASTTANSGLTGTNTNLVFAAKVNTPLHGTKPLLPATTVSTTKPTLGLTMPQTSTSATSGFKLGSSASGTTTTATASGFKLPVATSSTAAPSATTTTASTEKYTYKQLEDQVNKWNIEVEEMERAFLEQAAQVNVADRELMENGEKIAVLHSEVERAKADQNRLNQELDFLVSQQNELEDLLKPLEDSVKQHSLEHNQEPDRERERIYGMAEKCDGQLKGMVQDLREIIDYLNSTNANQQQQDNPVIQIAKILNVHMDSLQWIDQNSALLQKRVDEIARLNDLRRRDHERSFRLGFD